MLKARPIFISLRKIDDITGDIYELEYRKHLLQDLLSEEVISLENSIELFLRGFPKGRAEEYASHLYWRTDEMAGPVSRAWKRIFNSKIVTSARGCMCSTNGCFVVIPTTSWSAYKKLLKDKNRKCEWCLKTEQERRAAHWKSMDIERQERIKFLRSIPYQEYLDSPEWKQTRSSALRRANFRCQMCGDKRPLQVHHNTYENRGCEQPSDVISICGDCHGKFHNKIPNPTIILAQKVS